MRSSAADAVVTGAVGLSCRSRSVEAAGAGASGATAGDTGREAAATTGEAAAGATIQLGAFPSQESAKKSRETMQKRFAYLSERSHSIIQADVNGRTFHRLRVSTGSAAEARDICSRLRVAGENCLVVN